MLLYHLMNIEWRLINLPMYMMILYNIVQYGLSLAIEHFNMHLKLQLFNV
jgi:hypothetical protein